MKFSISSTQMYAQLQTVSRVIASKNTMPILDNVLFELNGNQLKLTAADQETTMETIVTVNESEGQGKVSIDAKWLLNMLREFSEQPLTFDINDDNFAVLIASQNGNYTSIGQNGNEFPQMPAIGEDAQAFTMSAEAMLNGINKSLFCAGDDEIRPVMNGVFFDLKQDSLTLVATDAHKLVRLVNTTVHTDTPASFILPKKPANMLKNVLPKEEGDVQVLFDSKFARFTLGNYTIVCRQIEGRFPNYNAVIPQNNARKVVVDRVSLISAIKRVQVCASAASNLIKLHFADNQIEVSAQDIDFSIAAREMVACQYTDEPLSIGFKSVFLIELLSAINSTDVVIALADASRAGL
ncbi:MAG: DNA polymerase III subunit beta, partial [Paludibacteraceae bacterium]|nr:DNA polymerase III subunit beta [Paludibacteraceae bacterium]